MRKTSFAFLAFIFAATGTAYCDAGSGEIYQFVKTVTLKTEYGNNEPIVSRWTKSPSVSLFYATPEDEGMVNDLIQDLNRILTPAKFKIKISKPFNQNADFKVYFVPKNQFADIGREHHFDYVSGNDGFFNIRWNPGHEINRAVVLIDRKLKGKRKTHFIHEEITQALGLMNDSPLFSDSIFFEKGRNGGRAVTFSELDRKLIRFFYQHVKPGFSEEKLKEAFDKHWEMV